MQASIYKIAPFDINRGSVIKFQWNGGAISKIELVVRDNKTREIVYRGMRSNDNAIWNYEFPIETGDSTVEVTTMNMTNGKLYDAFLRVYMPSSTATGKWSDFQTLGTQFMCLEYPNIYFKSIEGGIQDDSNNVISSNSWQFVLDYEQANGEKIKSWIMTLYDANTGSELTSTGLVYMDSSAEYETYDDTGVKTSIYRTFNGFSDATEYYVSAKVETVNGMVIDDISPIRFRTHITKEGELFTKLSATNYPLRGGIELKSNLVSIDPYFLDKDHVFYFGKNGVKEPTEYIDLRDNELTYKDGYMLPDEFTFAMVAAGFIPNEICLSMQDADGDDTPKMDLYYRVKNIRTNSPTCYLELKVYDGFVRNIFLSNEIDLLSYTDFAQITIIREGHMYHINFKKMTEQDDSWATTHSELTKYFGTTLANFTYRNLLTNYMRYKDDVYYRDIEMNTDLNDIKTYGKYIVMTREIYNSLQNSPPQVSDPFRMTVSKVSNAIPYRQYVIVQDDTGPTVVNVMYSRNYNAETSSWSDWM